MHCNQNIWSRGNYGIDNDLLKMKGHEDSSYTRKVKIVSKILPNTMDSLGPPQARKNHFIWMGLLYGALGPGTTCWPGGGLKCSTGVGVKKWPPGGVDL